MAQFARQSVPRFASSTTSTQETGDNIGVMTQITIPAGATSVLISCITTGPVYIAPVGATTGSGSIASAAAAAAISRASSSLTARSAARRAKVFIPIPAMVVCLVRVSGAAADPAVGPAAYRVSYGYLFCVQKM